MVLVAISLSVLVTATAFTVDLGRVSTERRDLQKVADVAALDLSRRLDGRTAAEIVGDPAWQASIDATLERNGFAPTDGRTATVAIGSWTPATETFTPMTGTQIPTAVDVELASTVDYAFAPGGASPTRRAVAGQTAAAGHQVGSFAARLSTEEAALLAALTSDALGITVVGYEGLAGGQVALGDLADELGFTLGDVDGLAVAEVTVADVLRAEAEVLRRNGDLARASLVDAVVADLPEPDDVVQIAELMRIAAGGETAATAADLDALDLLRATAFVANGTNLLELPVMDLSVAGQVATVSTTAAIIEGPQWAFGPVGTTASTAQATIELQIRIVVPEVSDTQVAVRLQVGSAASTSVAIGCRSPQLLDLEVATGLVTSRAEVTSRLSLLGVPVADVALHAATSAPASTATVPFDLPPDPLGVPRQAPTSGAPLAGAAMTTDEVELLDGPIDGGVEPLVDALTATVVAPVLAQTETAVLQPLARALGLSVAGADVAPLAIGCSGPRLLG